MHEDNCFITLTYDDDHVPHDYSLNYTHFQKFMKRLRKAVGPTRFYMCGEYGETYGRPHFHACLFGFRFPDLLPWRKSSAGFQLYRSDMLESLWQKGNCEVGEVTFESAAYIARYIMKKVNGKDAESHYEMVDGATGEIYSRVPEFTHMSLKPGIGYEWFKKYAAEVFPQDRIVVRGAECKPPRYYKNKLDADSDLVAQIDYNRYLTGLKLGDDNTPERLAVREAVQLARIKTLKRSVE